MDIDEFIGCKIEKDGDWFLLLQPDLIKKLMEKLGDEVMKSKDYKTLDRPGMHLMRPLSEEEKLIQDKQSQLLIQSWIIASIYWNIQDLTYQTEIYGRRK